MNPTDDTTTLNDQLLKAAEEADNVLEAVKDQTQQLRADLEAAKNDYEVKAQAVKASAHAAPAVTVETTTTAPMVPTL